MSDPAARTAAEPRRPETSTPPADTRGRPVSRRVPALVLFLLAPLVGELLLGNLPLGSPSTLAALPVLTLLYGGGAVLIREVAVRARRGRPTVVLLALAYGLIEEGLVTQSLFNPSYATLDLHGYGIVPGLGASAPWALFVLSIHSVWSIVVPIVLVETLYPCRRATPWLGRPGLALMSALYLLGALAMGVATLFAEWFGAGPGRLAGVAVLAALLVTAALVLPRRDRAGGGGRAPHPPAALAAAALAGGSALFLLYHFGASMRMLPAGAVTAAMLVLLVGTAAAVLGESRRAGWQPRHEFALAAGAILVYAWAGWLVQIGQYGAHPVGVAVQCFLVAAAGGLLLAGRRRLAALPTGRTVDGR
ncbi:hypothetical protein CLV63_10469 [Murinocardiopsis flavida]|uniref:DUF998 domain-containing protein n=1 Tax=Murinocardiopsis flavida TaxID=645275 RepID=A0A2P8DNP6_9ACTN|nr:hypothetical protein [Murinocardiopsis flavida]PSK98845.1 hypothetical protein CLV63_10469 [Murinocardiopsis flavida]